jgi:GxxExxY protein
MKNNKTSTFHGKEPDIHTDRLAHSIIGVALEVHKRLGPGYLEAIYERAFCIELNRRGIPYKNQVCFDVLYKGYKIGESRLDLVINDLVIVELKSVELLTPFYIAQVIAYLKSSKCKLLINFINVAVLKHGIRRIVYSK